MRWNPFRSVTLRSPEPDSDARAPQAIADDRPEAPASDRPSSPLRPTFLDPERQADFDRDGFVVVDLLDERAIKDLTRALLPLLPAGDGFTNSVEVLDTTYRTAVHAAIAPVLGPPASALMIDHRVNITAIALKRPGAASAKAIHQDWSLCDEARFRMVNVWVPLVDTDEHNGTLSVLPGSHSLVRRLRTAPRFPSGYRDVLEDLVPSDLVPVPVRAGQAIMIDVALVHASAPNLSGVDRIVAVVNLLPTEAALTYSYCHDDGRIEQFEVDGPEFFHRFDWRSPPQLPSLGIVNPAQPVVSAAQLRNVPRPVLIEPADRRAV